MPIKESKWIWRDGEMIPWASATTHVMSHALHYATAVFEGVRAYETKHKGKVVFRNYDHAKRFLYSARVYRLNVPRANKAKRGDFRGAHHLIGAHRRRRRNRAGSGGFVGGLGREGHRGDAPPRRPRRAPGPWTRGPRAACRPRAATCS